MSLRVKNKVKWVKLLSLFGARLCTYIWLISIWINIQHIIVPVKTLLHQSYLLRKTIWKRWLGWNEMILVFYQYRLVEASSQAFDRCFLNIRLTDNASCCTAVSVLILKPDHFYWSLRRTKTRGLKLNLDWNHWNHFVFVVTDVCIVVAFIHSVVHYELIRGLNIVPIGILRHLSHWKSLRVFSSRLDYNLRRRSRCGTIIVLYFNTKFKDASIQVTKVSLTWHRWQRNRIQDCMFFSIRLKSPHQKRQALIIHEWKEIG